MRVCWRQPQSRRTWWHRGSVDVISFLGLGLFTAHIIGNLAVLA
jgi:hypothetical protein